MASQVDEFTRLEELLRWNLDPAGNGKGRPIHEYGLRVEKTPEGVLVVAVTPIGFNAEAMVFGVNGGGLTTSAELGQQIEQAAAARLEAERLVDEEQARVRAEEQAERQAQAEADAVERVRTNAAAVAQAIADEQARIKAAVDAALAARGIGPKTGTDTPT